MAHLITLGALIDRTVEHYRLHFKELIGISLWFVVAATPFLFAGYIAPFGVDEFTPFNETASYISLSALGAILTTIVGMWVSICLMLTIDARAKNTVPNHVALGKKSWKYLPSFLILSLSIAGGLSVIAVLCMMPGFLITFLNTANGAAGAALGILGVLLIFAGAGAGLYVLIRYGIAYAFAQYSLILETERPPSITSVSALYRALRGHIASSQKAVDGQWWQIALRILIPNLIISLLVLAVSVGTNLASTVFISFAAASLSALAITLISVALTLILFLVNALVLPLYSLTAYYLYDSIRQR